MEDMNTPSKIIITGAKYLPPFKQASPIIENPAPQLIPKQSCENQLSTKTNFIPITDKILAKMYYERWNGVLPQFYGADDALIEVPAA